MASPQSQRLAMTLASGKGVPFTPGSRVLHSPPSDDAIWRRLKEAGFDEESIKRRDKAALIAYIAKLEAEIFDHQHHMGLLILEQKELTSKLEQAKASAEAAELKSRRDQAAHVSFLVDARNREEALKKSLGVEKECIASLEKALHEMRAESAETKVAAENRLSEARIMVDDAEKKFTEAEGKHQAAESLQAEAKRYHGLAERKLQEVGGREDDLRRRILSFKSECDAKENEIFLERQSLGERQKILEQGEKRLLDGQSLLNQREEYISSRSQELSRLEKQLEASKSDIEKQHRALIAEKSNLELRAVSLLEREKDVLTRETLLNKKEQELLVLREKLASKELDEMQKIIVDNEAVLQSRKAEFEAEMELKRKLVEDEIENKQRAWELREMDLRQQEDQLREKEHDLDVQLKLVGEKDKDVKERLDNLDRREKDLASAEDDIVLKGIQLQKEKEEINKVKQDLQKSLDFLEDKKKQVDGAKDQLEQMKNEASELSILEVNLKEELDRVRAQKLELMAEADKLKLEKGKFEAEWEFIDQKREELKKDAERISEERMAVAKFLKDERESLRIGKDTMYDQYKRDMESLNREREEFMNRMVHEHSEWFAKIQQERADFLLEIEVQKKELEKCIDKRREELETSLRDKEKAFEEEKKNELQYINSLKETAEKELDRVASEMKKLESERMEINSDRERRDREWAELQNSIEELKLQRQKLKRQRELLHADREEIRDHIEQLKKLEDLKMALDRMAVIEMQNSVTESSKLKISGERLRSHRTSKTNNGLDLVNRVYEAGHGNTPDSSPLQKINHASSPSSARFSWIRRCADVIFRSSDKHTLTYEEPQPLTTENNAQAVSLVSELGAVQGYDAQRHERGERLNGNLGINQRERHSGEEKMIFEVPTGGEEIRDEPKKKETASQKSSDSISHQRIGSGKKRRAKELLPKDFKDVQTVQRKSKKNRGLHHDDSAADFSDLAMTDTNAAQPNVAVGDASPSSNGAPVIVEETRVLVVDQVVDISVSSEKAHPDKDVIEDNTDHMPNSLSHLGQDVLEGGPDLNDAVLEGDGVVAREITSEKIVMGAVVASDPGQAICHDVCARHDQIHGGQGPPKSDTHGDDGTKTDDQTRI